MEQQVDQVTKGFEKALNGNGYGFQYKIVDRVRELFSKNQCSWGFEVSEFPVGVQGSGTRIDFVLQRHTSPSGFRESKPFYIIAECKRADPALSNWCFARSPYVTSRGDVSELLFERLHFGPRMYASAFRSFNPGTKPYHVGLEVKSNVKGEGHGGGRTAIEDAATQVCRGMNGFAEFFLESADFLTDGATVDLLPVIFTTANLWGSDISLTETDLETGNISLDAHPLVPCNWLLYQYHLSPGLKHKWPKAPSPTFRSLEAELKSHYIRTIPIVNPAGLIEFLRWVDSIDLEH